MSLFPDQPPPSPPAKPKMSAEERRLRQEDRLKTIRLRMAIYRYLDDHGITTPVEIDTALGMPAAEAASLLARHQWREGPLCQRSCRVFRTAERGGEGDRTWLDTENHLRIASSRGCCR